MHPYPCFIGGEPRLTAATIRNVNPSDLTDVVGEYCAASLADTHDAIAAAHGAFAAWRKTNALKRSEILDRIGGEILARAGELGDLLAREEGKTLPDGVEPVEPGDMVRLPAAFSDPVRTGLAMNRVLSKLNGDDQLTTLSIQEPALVYLKESMVAGFILASPAIFWDICACCLR